MASNLKYAAALKNAQQDAITTLAGNAAKLRLYSGAQPATPDTAVGAQVMLAELVMGTPFAAGAASGVLTLGAISNGTGTAGASTGTTAAWFRIVKADGTTPVMDGTVGSSGADLNINNTSIATGQTVSVTGGTLTNAN